MGVKRLEDLRCWELARAFKLEVYRVLQESSAAQRDDRYRFQLMDAAASGEANIAEGFRRFGAKQFVNFLSYAIGSIEETRRRLQDGADRGYFSPDRCEAALALGLSALKSTTALKSSLLPYARTNPNAAVAHKASESPSTLDRSHDGAGLPDQRTGPTDERTGPTDERTGPTDERTGPTDERTGRTN